MELEHAEESRAEPAKPACFTPKEQRAAFIHPAQIPNGKPIKLLKTLLSSACERDCYYCPFRAGRDFRRATFKPQEFAERALAVKEAGYTGLKFMAVPRTEGRLPSQRERPALPLDWF